MNKQNKILTIAICTISLAFVAICTLLVIIVIQLNNKNTDVSSYSASSLSLQSDASSESQATQAVNTSTPLHNISSKPSPSFNTPSKQSSTIMNNTISSNTSSISPINEEKKREFIRWYNQAENNYKAQLLSDISLCDQEVLKWKSKSSEYYSTKLAQETSTNNRFAEMGMTNSGAHQKALQTIENNYQIAVRECREKIELYTTRKSSLEEQLQNINPYTVLSVLVQEQGITISEATEMYLKYIG